MCVNSISCYLNRRDSIECGRLAARTHWLRWSINIHRSFFLVDKFTHEYTIYGRIKCNKKNHWKLIISNSRFQKIHKKSFKWFYTSCWVTITFDVFQKYPQDGDVSLFDVNARHSIPRLSAVHQTKKRRRWATETEHIKETKFVASKKKNRTHHRIAYTQTHTHNMHLKARSYARVDRIFWFARAVPSNEWGSVSECVCVGKKNKSARDHQHHHY